MKAAGSVPAQVSKSRAAVSLRWCRLRWSLAMSWSRTRARSSSVWTWVSSAASWVKPMLGSITTGRMAVRPARAS